MAHAFIFRSLLAVLETCFPEFHYVADIDLRPNLWHLKPRIYQGRVGAGRGTAAQAGSGSAERNGNTSGCKENSRLSCPLKTEANRLKSLFGSTNTRNPM